MSTVENFMQIIKGGQIGGIDTCILRFIYVFKSSIIFGSSDSLAKSLQVTSSESVIFGLAPNFKRTFMHSK